MGESNRGSTNGGDEDLGGVDNGDESARVALTTIVSGSLDLGFGGVLEGEFLEAADFLIFESAGDGRGLEPLSRSAGKGDRSGGRSKGFSELVFEAFFVSTDLDTAFLG